MMGHCVGSCAYAGPPPDSILSMPPPPLPSFLLPKSALLASLPNNNDSNLPAQHPCFASFLCEPNPHPRESGIEFVEFNGDSSQMLENTWFFVLISSCVGVLILGGLLAVILLKCRDTLFSSCSFSYHDSNIKQGTMATLGEPSKANPFMAGGILYPCTSSNNRDALQSQLANDSRLLWATLTPHGTRHFVSDRAGTMANARGNQAVPEAHYEVIDYRNKMQTQTLRDYTKRTTGKSFDNNGFVDYDYEDPTPLMDSYHDDLDSGYQEPQEIMSSLPRASPRPLVSSPTRIDNPNMAPLNYYPSYQRAAAVNKSNNSLHVNHALYNGSLASGINTVSTMNRKATVNRRISDASTAYNGSPNI